MAFGIAGYGIFTNIYHNKLKIIIKHIKPLFRRIFLLAEFEGLVLVIFSFCFFLVKFPGCTKRRIIPLIEWLATVNKSPN